MGTGSEEVMIELSHGECREVMQKMPDNSVDAIVTDPPYGLKFMGKKWDVSVPSIGIWKECLRVLKPGGHLLAFAGTRTQHRMAVNIEDAGFEIRDMIAWLYGTGFPKSLNLKDDMQGWGTALKPALEPITVARKPIVETVNENVKKYGTGAINIDACRVYTEDNINGGAYSGKTRVNGFFLGLDSTDRKYVKPSGRWPANLIHDGSDEAMSVFPHTKSGSICKSDPAGVICGPKVRITHEKKSRLAQPRSVEGSERSAARFFYCAKASKKDRGEGNKHPTVKPTDLMRYLCRLVTPLNGKVLDPFMGSGSTGKAAVLEGFSFIGIEKDKESYQTAVDRIEKQASEVDSLS